MKSHTRKRILFDVHQSEYSFPTFNNAKPESNLNSKVRASTPQKEYLMIKSVLNVLDLVCYTKVNDKLQKLRGIDDLSRLGMVNFYLHELLRHKTLNLRAY